MILRVLAMHAIIRIYNDVQFIVSCLESIKTEVESIIIADGAYRAYYDTYLQFYPVAKPHSTNGSLEAILALKGLPDMTFLEVPQGGWLNQVVKMNALVDAVPEDDWFIGIR